MKIEPSFYLTYYSSHTETLKTSEVLQLTSVKRMC